MVYFILVTFKNIQLLYPRTALCHKREALVKEPRQYNFEACMSQILFVFDTVKSNTLRINMICLLMNVVQLQSIEEVNSYRWHTHFPI